MGYVIRCGSMRKLPQSYRSVINLQSQYTAATTAGDGVHTLRNHPGRSTQDVALRSILCA